MVDKKKRLFYLFVIFLVLFQGNASSNSRYPANGILIYHPERFNWYEASSWCERNGRMLVRLKSPGDYLSIDSRVGRKGGNFTECYWIGASDLEEEGRWRWNDGTDVVFNAWDPGALRSRDSLFKNCASMCYDKRVGGDMTWWDEDCHRRIIPICGSDPPSTYTPPVTTRGAISPQPRKTRGIRRIACLQGMFLSSMADMDRKTKLSVTCARMCMKELNPCAIMNFNVATGQCRCFSSRNVLQQQKENKANWQIWESF